VEIVLVFVCVVALYFARDIRPLPGMHTSNPVFYDEVKPSSILIISLSVTRFGINNFTKPFSPLSVPPCFYPPLPNTLLHSVNPPPIHCQAIVGKRLSYCFKLLYGSLFFSFLPIIILSSYHFTLYFLFYNGLK
jgi:hypothetical protein